MLESNGAALSPPRASLTNGSRYRVGARLAGLLALTGGRRPTWVAFWLGQSFAFIGFLHLVIVVFAGRVRRV